MEWLGLLGNDPLPGPAADALNRGVFLRSLACLGVGGVGLLGPFSAPVRREFRKVSAAGPPPVPPPAADDPPGGDWRVGHSGRDMMFYEEFHQGAWRRIAIDGEMLTGRAHHVIYFPDAATWQRYPEWARHRREEIISRIKSRFRGPDYEYDGGGTASTPAAPGAPVSLPSNDGTILPMLAFLVAAAAVCFLLTARGIDRGEIRLPVKHNPASRIVTRAESPALFWASIGTLATIGTGCAGCGVWLLIGGRRRS